ncbi:Mannan endo-1,4-beta-mannosidase 6 [Hibiscus syriacus]|uniref:mannan endo-1,4-beta-mannosidase n=1 Tax=Hibiscus syriacus TaxID=106335 RepID=A0A6A2YH78_HIBSY|nr:Mannan endo-1,4-beta-mannosidase 6 [Hibiscus syriacus]
MQLMGVNFPSPWILARDASFFLLAFLVFFFDDSGTGVFGFQGEELIETVADEVLVTTRQGVYNVEELDDDDDWQMVSELFQQASLLGLTICRTWAFNDGQWRALQKSPSFYDEDVFKVLISSRMLASDRLHTAHGNGIHLNRITKHSMLSGETLPDLNLTSDDEFFSHPTLRSYYKSHVKAVLNRVNTFTNITYKDDPTIFAWELMNEPRCTSDPSGDTLQSWISEMAAYVESIDAKHLVEIGALGIHFASVHIYADSWISQTISDAHLQFTKSWMEAHIEDAEKYLGMPVIFSEFGVSSKDTGCNSSYRDTLISTVYKTLLNSTKKGGSGAGSLLWQLFPDGTDYMDDGYAIVLSKSHSTANLISLHSTRLAIFNSRCSWHCRWGCRKKNSLETFLNHDNL